MKRFCAFIIVIGMIGLWGCGSPEEPAEPTPDLQSKILTNTLMEQLFVDLQYAYHLSTQAMNSIENNLLDYGETNKAYINEIIEYFNSPGKLADRLDTKLKLMQRRKIEIEGKENFDAEAYKNLMDLMKTYEQAMELITTVPKNIDQFSSIRRQIDKRFSTLVRLLQMKFPQAESEFLQRKSPESPEFRSDIRLIEAIPSPKTPEEADVEMQSAEPDMEPTAVPTFTPAPVGVWRDEEGNIHMGQRPVEAEQSEAVPAETNLVVETPPVPTPEPAPQESGSSKIWTDEEGNVHMSSDQPPEGVKTKEAREIPLLIGD